MSASWASPRRTISRSSGTQASTVMCWSPRTTTFVNWPSFTVHHQRWSGFAWATSPRGRSRPPSGGVERSRRSSRRRRIACARVARLAERPSRMQYRWQLIRQVPSCTQPSERAETSALPLVRKPVNLPRPATWNCLIFVGRCSCSARTREERQRVCDRGSMRAYCCRWGPSLGLFRQAAGQLARLASRRLRTCELR